MPRTRGFVLMIAGYCAFVSSAAEAQRDTRDPGPDSPSKQVYLEDIIVTARRRPESLQRVPVSVVIPTVGRTDLLGACLESLVACDPAAAEVILVDQSGGTHVAEVAE